jgi:FkbM family methyltransferase
MHPLNHLLLPLGFRINRLQPKGPQPKSDYVTMLDHFGINLILDVGAHKGAAAQRLFESGYTGRIVSFEPVRAHFDVLTQKSAEGRQRGFAWEVRHAAIGDTDGTTEINISKNGASSSIAEMLPTHERLNADSKYTGKETITLHQLDTVLPEIARPGDRILLLLDVQGFEPQALAGAKNSLPGLAGVQLEVGFRPTYATGFDIPGAFAAMSGHGFTPCYVEPAWKDPKSCVFYQVDVLWFRVPETSP